MNANSLPGGWLESGHGSISIYVKDFRDPLERKKKLILRPWASIKDIKDQLQVVFNVPSNVQKLYFHGRELKNAHNLQQCGIYQDNVVVDFVARRANNLAFLYGTDSNSNSNASPSTISSSSSSTTTFLKSASLNGLKTSSSSSSSSSSSMRTSSSSTLHVTKSMPVVNIHPYGAHLLPVALMKVLHQALQGLALGLAPVLAMDGTGGTYFLKDPTHRNVGCFKPQDEEPFGPHNPRGLVGELGQSGLRRGILSGEACERELAAYLLDRDHFAGVPATSLVEARHPVFQYKEFASYPFKMGSLQEFVKHDDVASDIAPSLFSAHQVHKIVLLDMRLLNTDRNDANILVRKRRTLATSTTPSQVEYELIPIDHGYCLPQFLEIAWCDWCWYNWPQLSVPLSAQDKAYVLAWKPVEDADRLARKIPLRRACRRNMVIAGMLVQKAVRADVVLYETAKIMCRDDLDAPSPLEKMCLDAFQLLQRQRKTTALATENGVSNGHVAAAPSTAVAVAALATRESLTSGSAAADAGGGSSSRFANLRISTDVVDVAVSSGGSSELETTNSNSSSHGATPSNSGARSPPGFWASFTPFSSENGGAKKSSSWSWADDSDDEDDYANAYGHPAAAAPLVKEPVANQASSFVKWDTIAATALHDAADATQEDGGAQDQEEYEEEEEEEDEEDDRASIVSSSSTFAGDGSDKDEFELLNDALDDNLQDEKLFLGILGRLMDDKISECVRRNLSYPKPQASSMMSSSSSSISSTTVSSPHVPSSRTPTPPSRRGSSREL